ncbi:hypothetical protein [Nocardiopsis sp. CNR-923]|uniref:hypothetical protein n=1 Tax=Nocardiopsis sp. CNR-923 TaxID=1904965 RepID=UPI0021CD101F|nr:hypothetical protein [Nocardiopsis sp. CNR-923]
MDVEAAALAPAGGGVLDAVRGALGEEEACGVGDVLGSVRQGDPPVEPVAGLADALGPPGEPEGAPPQGQSTTRFGALQSLSLSPDESLDLISRYKEAHSRGIDPFSLA